MCTPPTFNASEGDNNRELNNDRMASALTRLRLLNPNLESLSRMSTEEILNHAIAIINEPFDLDFEHYEDQDNGQGAEQLRDNDDSALMRLRLLHPNLFRLPRMSSDEILNRAIAIVNEPFNLDLEEYQAEDRREGDSVNNGGDSDDDEFPGSVGGPSD